MKILVMVNTVFIAGELHRFNQTQDEGQQGVTDNFEKLGEGKIGEQGVIYLFLK